jgi:hypothetical protein
MGRGSVSPIVGEVGGGTQAERMEGAISRESWVVGGEVFRLRERLACVRVLFVACCSMDQPVL